MGIDGDRNVRRRRRQAGGIAVFAAAVLVVSFFLNFDGTRSGAVEGQTQQPRVRRASSENAVEQVRGLARLEPAQGTVGVGAQPGARILSVAVVEGQSVAAGDPLIVLEGRDQAEKRLELAKAEKQVADFQRDLLRRKRELERDRFDSLREERLDRQRERIEAMEERLRVAERNRERITGLDPTADRVAAQDYVINQSKAELSQARLELVEFETDLELLPRMRELEDEEVSDQHPDQRLLDRKIELAESELERTTIRSPIDGVVLEVLARAGETVSGPIMFLANTDSMVAVVELFQTDVTHVQVGDAAFVEIFDSQIQATVERIGRMVGSNQLTSVDPMALTDRRVVKVRLRLQESEPASRYVNMQVSAFVIPGSAPTPPVDAQE